VELREKVKQRMRGIERVRDWKRERCRERESERSGDRERSTGEERTRGDPATWGPTSGDARQSGGSCGAGLTPEEQEARRSVLGRRSGGQRRWISWWVKGGAISGGQNRDPARQGARGLIVCSNFFSLADFDL
jgi:hypothetical protein